MRITSLTITNYRSVRNAGLGIAPYTVLLGPNNSGKSNILRAVEFALTPAAKLPLKDYPSGVQPLIPTTVDLVFDQLTDKENVEFNGYLRGNGTLGLRRTTLLSNDHPDHNGYRVISKNGKERRLPVGFIKPGMLPEFFFIPALFDLDRELTPNQTSHFGRMLQRLLPIAQGQLAIQPAAGFANLLDPWGLNELMATLSNELTAFGAQVVITPPTLSLSKYFELGAELVVNDGASTSPSRKGHGVQRALVFAIIREWARLVAQPAPPAPIWPAASESVIFAVEEPELNIHPHGVRKLVADLANLAKLPNKQVLLCSHSPHFVDLATPDSIKLVSKANAEAGTTVRECIDALFAGTGKSRDLRKFNATYYFNPDRSELFFAEKIVLVEGATEKKLLPFLAERLGVFRAGVSVIDCDGKSNLRLFMEVLNQFQLPYTVMHDVDPLPANPNSSATAIFAENDRIFALAAGNEVIACDPDFEGLAGMKRRRRSKPFSAHQFFTEKKVADINPDLVTKINKIYAA